MPWKCPACDTPIKHSELEQAPRRDVTYRCHICRLELILDESDNLAVAPMRPEPGPAPPLPKHK